MKVLIKHEADLIGDCLCAFPAILKKAESSELSLWIRNKHVQSLFKAPSHLTLLLDEPSGAEVRKFDQVFSPNLSTVFFERHAKEHMIQTYFHLLELPIPQDIPPPSVQFAPTSDRYDFLISPYSYSGTLTKEWPLGNWYPILDRLLKVGSVGILGSGQGLYKNPPCPFFQSVSYVYDRPLPEVATLISRARLVLTVDNGISHLTHAVGAPHILLYPIILPVCWVQNPRNNVAMIREDPARLNPDRVLNILNFTLTRF